MNIENINRIIDGKIICSNDNQTGIFERAFASDLMSDVLTINTDHTVLITGLMNMQTIRTAEMVEIKAIVLARGKNPTREMLELAAKENISLIESEKSIFHISGLLFEAGIKPVYYKK